jgi:PAS domain S-box-containing protein
VSLPSGPPSGGPLQAEAPAAVETEADKDSKIESLQRKVNEYDRWFRFLDGQMRVLERERQKLSAVVNHADAGFLVLDPSLLAVWANEQLTGWFGGMRWLGSAPAATAATVRGEACRKLLCGAAAPCEGCPAARAFSTGETAHLEIRREIEGRTRQIYATAVPIRSVDGEIEETMVMLQDVTDLEVLRRSREALQAGEEQFRSIFEHPAAGMAMVSDAGRLLKVNRAMCEFIGYPESELIGRTVMQFTHPDDIPLTLQQLESVVTGASNTVSFEKRFLRKDGTTVWGHVSSTWVRDAQGGPLHGVTLVLDITGRKRAERKS